ncbi:MAG: protein kinase [Ignavibacteria bacterium]|nr:protein kinase [Ignavibacteria bacterium]
MIGQTVSHYKIIEKLGEGGMGVVYKAEDLRLRRLVALKFLPPDFTKDERAKKRFGREARAASALDHPNIAVVHDIGESPEGQSFICMAYYEGRTVKQHLDRGPLDAKLALKIAAQVADGLQRAHEAGIVHCDIKPANLIVTNRGEVKILDFGVARLGGETKSSSTSTTGGTLAYMSPEQARGETVDKRSDVFSLGVVLYEMITGRRPFHGEHDAAVLYSIVNAEPEPPATIDPNITPEMESMILRLLRKDVSDRYQSASELRKAIDSILGPAESPPLAPSKFKLRMPGWKILAPISLLIVAFVLYLLGIFPGRDASILPKDLGITVLRFESADNDRAAELFCYGMMDILTDRVTQLKADRPGLWVIAASEVRRSKVTNATDAWIKFRTPRAIGGKVYREGETYRVLVHLTETSSGIQSQSTQFRTPISSYLQLETEITSAIARWLNITPSEKTRKYLAQGRTANAAAYDLYVRGRGYLHDFDKPDNVITAINLLRDATKEDSLFVLASAALSEACLRRFVSSQERRWATDAGAAADRAISLDAANPAGHIAKGQFLVNTGKFREAAQAFQRTLDIDPGIPAAWAGLANAYDEQDDTSQAVNAFKKAINREPQYWAYRNSLGAFYDYRGREAEALEQFQKVIELAPGNTYGYNNIGGVLMKMERYKEAREVFLRSIAVEPTKEPYANLGTIAFREQNWTEAAVAYEFAVQLAPLNYQYVGYLAEAYWRGKRDTTLILNTYRHAAALAESLRTLTPNKPDLLYQLAGFYVRLDQKSIARQLLARTVQLQPMDGRVLVRTAMIYEELADRKEAIELLRRAVKVHAALDDIEGSLSMKRLREDPAYRNLVVKRE